MTIDKKTNDASVELKLSGRLDTTTAPELEAELQDVLADTSELLLDFDGLEYLSSAGLRVLLAAQKKMNAKSGTMKLRNVNATIMEIFDITGFSDILTIE